MGHRIVLVDNDAEDCFIMSLAFEEVGLKEPVVTFTIGEELISYLEDGEDINLPTLIVLHFNVHRSSGEKLLQYLTTHPRYENIPVVVYAAEFTQEELTHCLSMGAQSCHERGQTYYDAMKLARQFVLVSKPE